MKTTVLLILGCALVSGCGSSEASKPAASTPATSTTAAPAKADNLSELLKRADAAVPKDTPDTQPGVPTGVAPPEKIVVIERARSAPSSGSSATPTSRAVPAPATSSTSLQAPADSMIDKAERLFGSRIDSLSNQKSGVASSNSNKTGQCTGSLPMPENARPGSLTPQKADTPECKQAISRWEQSKTSFQRAVDGLEIEAKQAGILPGTIRELYARHGFSPY
jgi:hypothetical protein